MEDHKLLSHNHRAQLNRPKITSWFLDFHRTRFTLHTIDHLLIWSVVLYVYFSIMLVAMSIVNRLVGITIPHGSSTLIDFVFTEVFPLALLASFFSRYHHWFRHWLGIFWQDLKKNWRGILSGAMVLFAIQIILGNLLSFFASGGELRSQNTATVIGDVKQNIWLLIMTLLIAPIFEELVFRFLLTNSSSQLINKFLRVPKLSYWFGMLISAFLFALLHDGWSWDHILIYMACALFLQFIQKKTQSLTAPVLVHGMSNLIVMALALL